VRGEGLLGRAARRGGDVPGVCRWRGPLGGADAHGELQALAHADDALGEREGGGGGDVLEQLLADAGAAVLGLLELGDPVVDGGVQLREGLLLLEDGVVAELGGARGPEVLADPRVEVAPPGPEGGVCAAKVLSTLVEMSELL